MKLFLRRLSGVGRGGKKKEDTKLGDQGGGQGKNAKCHRQSTSHVFEK